MIAQSKTRAKYQRARTAAPIFRPDGKVVGHVRGNVFHKVLRSSKHFLRRPPSIAFDVSTLDAAEQAGAISIEVYDTDEGKKYRADLATVRRYGMPFDRSFGRQTFLTLDRWSIDGAPAAADVQEQRQRAKAEATQPALFEMAGVSYG